MKPPQAPDEFLPHGLRFWLVPVATVGVLAAALLSYDRDGEIQAAPGSPYYDKAVREAIHGLQNPGAKALPAAGIPPLPAGLSPDEHYWCENCKTYHKRVPGQSPPAAGVTPPAAPAAIPPLPEGLSPADYYWCENCKTYHARDSRQAAHPGGAVAAPAWRGVPFPHPARQGAAAPALPEAP
jgi:hypothetical protein